MREQSWEGDMLREMRQAEWEVGGMDMAIFHYVYEQRVHTIRSLNVRGQKTPPHSVLLSPHDQGPGWKD